MVKTVDIDRLFDKYIEGYVYANVGKIKPEEIENKIPVLYTEFGDVPQKELDGKTPNAYYRQFSAAELIGALKTHIEKDVEVSDFLIEAITAVPSASAEITKELFSEHGEQFTAYLMNMLSDVKGEIPVERYLEFAVLDYPESVAELAVEALKENADKAKDKIVKAFDTAEDGKKHALCEILSCVTQKSDDVYDILCKSFIENKDKIPFYANLIAKYGDARALPLLKATIEGKVNYQEFEELKFAIEVLGGEYEEKRDWSQDAIFRKVKGESKNQGKNKKA